MTRRLALLLTLLTFGGAQAAAHPHVWAKTRAEISIDAGYVEGVWAVWTFDDVFSQLILADNDNGDGKITAAENASIKKTYFDNLKGFQYFTHVVLGARTIEITPPTRFTASVKDNLVTYRFFLPLGLRLDTKTPLAVSFYDDSFYTDMVFEKGSPVTITAKGGKAVATFRPDASRTFYGGQVTPTFAFITWNPQ